MKNFLWKIFGTIYNMEKMEYLDVHTLNGEMIYTPLALIEVTNITVKGHRFLDTIKPDGIWNKTKCIVSQIGNHTLEFIEDTAQKIAVESAKQMITVTMSKR